RVARSQDGRGEEVWKVEAEHSKEPERAAEQGADSGDPTGSQSGGLVVAEDPTEMAVERSGRGFRRPHASNCSRMGRPQKKTAHTAAFRSPALQSQRTASLDNVKLLPGSSSRWRPPIRCCPERSPGPTRACR